MTIVFDMLKSFKENSSLGGKKKERKNSQKRKDPPILVTTFSGTKLGSRN